MTDQQIDQQTDQLETWRDRAARAAAEGLPDEALELHRRYFTASRDVPALYGVRLSFALTEWGELAASYPPAREALVATRQEAVDRLTGPVEQPATQRLDTPGDAFAEVAALSDVLGEPGFAVDLFARLDEQAPDTAADCAIAAHRLLMRAGRYDLARRHLTDPLGKVGRLADVLQMRLARNPGLLSEAVRESRRGEAVRDYVAGVQEVLTLLRASGDDELAEATRRKAVEDVVWGHLRDEVEQALPPPSRG